MRPVSLLVAVLLLLVAVIHLVRMVFGVEVVVGGMAIPMWPSPVACIVLVVLAVLLWRESRK